MDRRTFLATPFLAGIATQVKDQERTDTYPAGCNVGLEFCFGENFSRVRQVTQAQFTLKGKKATRKNPIITVKLAISHLSEEDWKYLHKHCVGREIEKEVWVTSPVIVRDTLPDTQLLVRLDCVMFQGAENSPHGANILLLARMLEPDTDKLFPMCPRFADIIDEHRVTVYSTKTNS